MGGRNSTRWRTHRRRPLVEETRRIDFNTPPWRAIFAGFAPASGQLVWSNAGGEQTGTVEFELGRIEENRERALTLTLHGEDPVFVNLKETEVGFDARWHSKCPLDCGRSTRSLFLAPDGQLGCRSCLRLVYNSSRKSDKRVDSCRRNPAEFVRGRARLATLRSRLVTSWIFVEAERRGFHTGAT